MGHLHSSRHFGFRDTCYDPIQLIMFDSPACIINVPRSCMILPSAGLVTPPVCGGSCLPNARMTRVYDF